ncbi:flagellar assembly protein FliW [Nocardioides bruguierae]|uniref:flagellar assembly protein FliW n=1 Tax=Nocardioides bruguierae TaxID=2945102 RepID=UPI002022243F|nr:flagellar assembly protein FliW [Nocardioides bruguierae]MCL8027648.1 flagellar assembly protein FliW [Nocardioides bruguierae]
MTTSTPQAEGTDAGAVISLVRPLPGFPGHHRFTLEALDDAGVLSALRSVEDETRFLVVPPHTFFPDYAPVVDDTTQAELGLETAEDVLLLVVLTPGESLAGTTANLLAPVVVNRHTLAAAQVILDDASLTTAVPLV